MSPRTFPIALAGRLRGVLEGLLVKGALVLGLQPCIALEGPANPSLQSACKPFLPCSDRGGLAALIPYFPAVVVKRIFRADIG